MDKEEITQDGAVKARHFFKAENDAALLELVRVNNPFTAGHGNVAKLWELVTQLYNRHFELSDDAVGWKVIRKRATHLLDLYKKEEMHSLRKSGKTEDYTLVMTTLEDIRTQIADHQDSKEMKMKEKEAANNKLVSDGAKHRETACSRLNKRDTAVNDDVDGFVGETPKKKVCRKLLTPEDAWTTRQKSREAELELREREIALQERKLTMEEKRWADMQDTATQDREERNQDRKMMLSLLECLIKKG
jgi:hypothetical protein